MATTFRTNVYRPLTENQIRLLVLEPGNEDSELRCKIICGSLNDYYLPYEALSYAWGDQSDVAEALCNDVSIKITRSLHDALRAIRLTDATRDIWVDALSINQFDIEERNHQVQLMAQIYSGATRVIVWLGEPDPDTASALEMISHCAKAFELRNDSSQWPDAGSNHIPLSNGMPSPSDSKWKLLGNFLLRPWFKRAWVVQEVALASEVIFHCGTITIPWEHVLKAMMGIFSMDLGDLVTNENESIICLHFYQRAYELGRSYLGDKSDILRLEVLLLAEGARLASDDRDKVFAFLGLANDVQSSNNPSGMAIQADYGKEASDIYTEITRTVIEHYHSLTILAAAGLPAESGPHMVPSWVCDRSLKPRANVFMSPAAKQQFSACDAPANCRFTPDQKGLITTGVIHDTISVIGRAYSHRDLEDSVMLQWGEIAGLHKFPVAPDEINSFRLTLVGNFGQDGALTDFELESFFPWYENIYLKKFGILPWEKQASPHTDIERVRMIRRFTALVHRASGWRSFFLTEGALMGIGPATAALGDLVCIVEGATVPLVLRNEDGERQFCFVGSPGWNSRNMYKYRKYQMEKLYLMIERPALVSTPSTSLQTSTTYLIEAANSLPHYAHPHHRNHRSLRPTPSKSSPITRPLSPWSRPHSGGPQPKISGQLESFIKSSSYYDIPALEAAGTGFDALINAPAPLPS